MALQNWIVDPEKINVLKDMQKYSDEPVISTLVEMFLEMTPLAYQRMKTDLQNQDLIAIAKEAHKLKSSCGTLGLTSMVELFSDMEESIRKGSPINLSEALIIAEQYLSQSKVYLTELK